MRSRHYSDYLMAKPGCLPKMTKEFSDRHPSAWLGFYPHQTFLRVLSTLFDVDGVFARGIMVLCIMEVLWRYYVLWVL